MGLLTHILPSESVKFGDIVKRTYFGGDEDIRKVKCASGKMAAWMWIAALLCGTQAAVLPPPWADVRRNPCASHPRGWLMLYWPSDGKCYTIYKVNKG